MEMDSKKISGCQGFGEKKEGLCEWSTGFLGGEPILYATVIPDTWHYTFVKTYGTLWQK